MLTKKEHQAAFEKIRDGLATKIRILVPDSACLVCQTIEGVYDFDDVPELPPEGYSCTSGFCGYYAPVLDQFGP